MRRKSKIRVVSIALLLVISLILVSGCAPGAPGKIDVPPEVKIAGVYPLDLGSGGVTYNLVFSVSNPNSAMVVMDTLEYNISTQYTTILDEVETIVLARAQILDDVYVPANTEVRVTNAFAVALGTVIGEVYMAKGADALLYLPQSMQDLIASGQMDEASASGMVSVGAIAAMFPLWKLLGAGRPPIDPNLDTYLELGVWDVSAEGPPLWTVKGTASFLPGSVTVEFEDQWQAE
jgi:hypothetical protein